MTKKRISVVFTAALLLLSLFPLLGLALFGSGESAANEHLSARPALRVGGALNENYLNELSDYFADHFALRREAATLWARLNASLLRTSAEEQVLLGSDGWLYYSETLDDFSGLGLPDAALRETARDLRLMQQSLQARGADMLFVIAPNKNSLYPGQMPARLTNAHEGSNASRLLPMLSDEGVRTADLFAAFSAETDTLYYRTDSHWNTRGAALAADAILAALGRESDYFAAPFTRPGTHRGDLYEMLYPRGTEEESELLPAADFGYQSLNDPKGGDAITIRTENPAGQGTLYCWRDSFGAALYPYLAESFSGAVFSRSASYDLTGAEPLAADTVVLELVERNLANLWESPAVYLAPAAEARAEAETGEQVRALAESAGAGGLTRLTVRLPAEARDIGSAAYFIAGGSYYEAGVCACDEAGFVTVTACLPEGARAEGFAVVRGGVLTRYACITEGEQG